MRWVDNLPATIKLGLLSLPLILALVFTSSQAIDGYGHWSEYAGQIRDNRIPTIRALTTLSSERAVIRAQSYESLAETHASADKARLQDIAERRAQSWKTIDQNWAAVSKIPRLTENGRQQFVRMTESYQAWRQAYVELDALLRGLIESRDPAEFDRLMARYRASIEDTVLISNRMQETTDAMVSGNIERAIGQANQGTETAKTEIRLVTVLAAIIVLAAILLTGALFLSFARPLRLLVDRFAAIGNGDYEQEIDTTRRDEVGLALRGLSELQTKLKADIGETRRVAAQNLRIRYALDSVASNVMVSDADGEIIYANGAVLAMFRNALTAIRQDLPNFDPERLVGSSVDVFHKHPAHQRRMMEQMTSRHEAQVGIGGRTFSLIANPISSEQGARVGVVIEWKDRTEELKVEKDITGLVQGALSGDFSGRVETDELHGFFKGLGIGINTLMELTARGLGEVAEVLDAVSHGDLTKTVQGEYLGTFGQLKDDTNRTVGKLKELLGQIKASAEAIDTAAREISAGNVNLSQRTEEQASSLEETASSMEELTATVKQNADNARQANLLANGAREFANKGGERVQEAVAAMSAITESADKISNIIGVIDGIAFQTNILALNAAVEAARAGEQGRGFAVVASEVRSLAQRSAAAAKEIKTLIQEDATTIATGSKRVCEAGGSMEEIVNQVKRVSDLIAEISAASDEQTAGIEQVNQAIAQMETVTQQNTSLVEEATASAESLEGQAHGLSRAVSLFKVDHQPPQGSGRGAGGAMPGTAARLSAQTKTQPRSRSLPARGRAVAQTRGRSASAGDEWEEF